MFKHSITWAEQKEILGSNKGGSGISTLTLIFEMTTDVASFDSIGIGATRNFFCTFEQVS